MASNMATIRTTMIGSSVAKRDRSTFCRLTGSDSISSLDFCSISPAANEAVRNAMYAPSTMPM